MPNVISEFTVKISTATVAPAIETMKKFDGTIKVVNNGVKLLNTLLIGKLYRDILLKAPAMTAWLQAIGGAGTIIGASMTEALSPALDLVTNLAYGFAEWFDGLNEGQKKVVSTAVAAGGIAFALGQIHPLLGIAAGAVVIFGVAYAENFANIKTNTDNLIADLQKGDISAAFIDMQKLITDVIDTIPWDKIYDFAKTAFDKVVNFILTHDWAADFKTLLDAAIGIFDLVYKFFIGIVDEIIKFFKNTDWGKLWSNVFAFVQNIVVLIANFMGKVVAYIVDFIINTDWVQLIWSIIKAIGSFIIEAVKWFVNPANWVSVISGTWSGFSDTFGELQANRQERGLSVSPVSSTINNFAATANNFYGGLNAGMNQDQSNVNLNTPGM